jgi:prepilin-type N-terminal cleavage/methylation domain-containing protein
MHRSGFSLIELVIVVAIMGLLGMVAIPSFSAIQNKTKNTTLKSTAHTLEMALETYLLDNSDYPSGENITGAALGTTLIEAGLLSTMPKNPFTGNALSETDTKGSLDYSQTDSGYTLIIYGSDPDTPIETIVR